MTRLLALAALLLVAAAPSPRQQPVTITLERQGNGGWIADYRFGEAAGAWVFPRSNPDIDNRPWRQRSWAVETRGVRLVRLGRYDALVGDGGVPRHVRIRVEPFGRPLKADYTPALIFSDGGIAFYTDQFLASPQPTSAAVAALAFEADLPERPTSIVVHAPGQRLLVRGVATTGVARLAPDATDTYVFAGATRVIATDAFAGIIDPGVPAWARGELDAFLPRLLGLYAARLGRPVGERPMVMVSWGGATRPGSSMGGSVLGGLVVMDLSGQQVLAPSAPVLDRLRWFFGHEAAHFWLGQTVHYQTARDAWITEGGADIFAIRALGVLAPGYDMRHELQGEVDDCLKVNGARPLSGASERGETRANYACGAVLMLAAEAAERRRAPGADAATFVRRLIDANRADGVVTARDWLDAFRVASGDAATTGRVAAFIDRGAPDSVAFLAELFTATGVPFTRTSTGVTLR